MNTHLLPSPSMGALVRRSAVVAAMFIFALSAGSNGHSQGNLSAEIKPNTIYRAVGPVKGYGYVHKNHSLQKEASAVSRLAGPVISEEYWKSVQPKDPADMRIPILVYHHVREHEGWAKSTWSWKMTVSPTNFDQQMQWLKEHGYTTISLDTLVNILDGKEQGPQKPIVLTFDDNNLDVLENGLNAMTSRGHIGVFYLVANRLNQPGIIGRAHIPDLLSKGMDIQSHTMSHAGLTNLSNAQVTTELVESKRILEEITGKTVQHVAYPLTMHNQRIRDLAKDAGYVTGTIMDPRSAKGTDDRMKLPRIMMTDDTNMEQVLP